jgi:phospholipase C
MGYYDEGFLNYYYYMASQFAVSDRWFSPIANKTNPNRIATYSGGTTQGLVFDPGTDDNLGALDLPSIFQALDTANVSWKVYYSATQGNCGAERRLWLGAGKLSRLPVGIYQVHTHISIRTHRRPPAPAPLSLPAWSAIHSTTSASIPITSRRCLPISPISRTAPPCPALPSSSPPTATTTNTLPPTSPSCSGRPRWPASCNAFMASPEWKDGVFFFSYDEGGGLYDHVPPVPQHSNDNTDFSLSYPRHREHRGESGRLHPLPPQLRGSEQALRPQER